jgi:hypothetical protein
MRAGREKEENGKRREKEERGKRKEVPGGRRGQPQVMSRR